MKNNVATAITDSPQTLHKEEIKFNESTISVTCGRVEFNSCYFFNKRIDFRGHQTLKLCCSSTVSEGKE